MITPSLNPGQVISYINPRYPHEIWTVIALSSLTWFSGWANTDYGHYRFEGLVNSERRIFRIPEEKWDETIRLV